MTYLPSELGVVDKILDAMVSLLTLKLQTEIPAADASRLVTIKVGPRQDDPSAVVVLLHENDPVNPQEWQHHPLRFGEMQPTGNLTGLRHTIGAESESVQRRTTTGYELVGGGSMMARCFTVEVEIWGDEVDLDMARRDVGQLASVLEQRIIKSLKDAGPKIGTGSRIQDSFGEKVIAGPFWGDAWTDQEEGEALIVRKYIRLHYKCFQSWSTSGW